MSLIRARLASRYIFSRDTCEISRPTRALKTPACFLSRGYSIFDNGRQTRPNSGEPGVARMPPMCTRTYGVCLHNRIIEVYYGKTGSRSTRIAHFFPENKIFGERTLLRIFPFASSRDVGSPSIGPEFPRIPRVHGVGNRFDMVALTDPKVNSNEAGVIYRGDFDRPHLRIS